MLYELCFLTFNLIIIFLFQVKIKILRKTFITSPVYNIYKDDKYIYSPHTQTVLRVNHNNNNEEIKVYSNSFIIKGKYL